MGINNDINYEALKKLLIKVKTNINNKISAIDVSAVQKAILNKADKIKTNGNGLSYLSDNGEYVNIDLDSLSGILKKSQDVVELFSITKEKDGSYTYNIKLPDDVQTQLDILNTTGSGTKVLTDNGTYKEYHTEDYYREMSQEEINTIIMELSNI